MKLSNKAINALGGSHQLKMKVAIALNVNLRSVEKYVRVNSVQLLDSKCLAVLKNELQLSASELTTDDRPLLKHQLK